MTLDLYYARRFVQWFALITLVLMTLVMLIDLTEQFSRFAAQDLGVGPLLTLTILNAPGALNQFLPLIMILSTIVLFVGMARSSELVVTRAVGRSGIRTLLGPLVVTLIIGALAVSTLNPLVAVTTNRSKELAESYRHPDSAATVSVSGEGIWLRQGGADGQSVIHAESYRGNADEIVLYRVSILSYAPDGGPQRRIVAEQAALDGTDWVLRKAKVWPLRTAGAPESASQQFDEMRLPTTLTNARIRDTLSYAEGISIYELPRTIEALGQTGFSTTQFRVWLQVELARPLLLVAMMLVGATFTMRHSRLGGTGLAVMMSVVLGFTLYFVHNFARILGENGQIPVLLAAWAPPVASILLTMGLLLHAEDG